MLTLIVYVIVALVVAGLVVWLVDSFPISPPFKLAIRVLVILALCIWLLSLIGVIGPFPGTARHHW